MTTTAQPLPPSATSRPSTLTAWLLAARPRTLAAGAVPVAVGTALAGTLVPIRWSLAAACLTGALLIQIGTNFANDAFDALKGADAADRLGPTRAVAAGWISARAMLWATAAVLAAAFAVGLYLSTAGGWPILVLGVVSLLCAVGYTAGPFPLAYHGLGDLFVLLFFGLFAVLGSAWVQVAEDAAKLFDYFPFGTGVIHGHDRLPVVLGMPAAWMLVALAVGFQATAIIAVNNLRDRDGDGRVGKRTLAVRFGDLPSRWYYASLHLTAVGGLVAAQLLFNPPRPWLWLPTAVAGAGGVAVSLGVFRAKGVQLNRYLARSAALELITGLCLVISLMI